MVPFQSRFEIVYINHDVRGSLSENIRKILHRGTMHCAFNSPRGSPFCFSLFEGNYTPLPVEQAVKTHQIKSPSGKSNRLRKELFVPNISKIDPHLFKMGVHVYQFTT